MKEIYEFYPIEPIHKSKIIKLLKEIEKTLLNRTDGVSFVIERDNQYPKLDNKNLISKVEIKTWDIAA